MAEPVQPDVILIPVHNRRDTTCGVLRALAGDGVFAWATVLVLDDGSEDGTGDAVRREFPAAYQVRGDGTWWWAGAIRRGMEWALARGAERLYWLNDDCRPPPGGLRALRDLLALESCVGWIEARAPGGWTFGGQRRTAWGLRRCPAGRAETFNGNCVGFPRAWVERVGLPHDHLFPHGCADLDYGLRLSAAGAPLRALPGASGTNGDPSRAAADSWLAGPRAMRAIWRDFASPRSYYYFPAWRAFCLRHWGPLWGWAVFVAPYARWAAIALVRAIAPGVARALARRRTLSSPSGPEGG